MVERTLGCPGGCYDMHITQRLKHDTILSNQDSDE